MTFLKLRSSSNPIRPLHTYANSRTPTCPLSLSLYLSGTKPQDQQQQQQQQQQHNGPAAVQAPLLQSKFLTVTPVAIMPSPTKPQSVQNQGGAAGEHLTAGVGSPCVEQPEAKRAKHTHLPPTPPAPTPQVAVPEAAMDGVMTEGSDEGERVHIIESIDCCRPVYGVEYVLGNWGGGGRERAHRCQPLNLGDNIKSLVGLQLKLVHSPCVEAL